MEQQATHSNVVIRKSYASLKTKSGIICIKSNRFNIRKTSAICRYLRCKNFEQDFVVPSNIKYMLIECRKSSHNSLIYQEGFFFIYSREDRSKYSRMDVKNSTRKFGILLFGIDSVSQFNARRTMPRVVRYMEARNWYELSGYNKVRVKRYV